MVQELLTCAAASGGWPWAFAVAAVAIASAATIVGVAWGVHEVAPKHALAMKNDDRCHPLFLLRIEVSTA